MELVIESCLQVFLESEPSQDLNGAWHVFYLMAFIFIESLILDMLQNFNVPQNFNEIFRYFFIQRINFLDSERALLDSWGALFWLHDT